MLLSFAYRNYEEPEGPPNAGIRPIPLELLASAPQILQGVPGRASEKSLELEIREKPSSSAFSLGDPAKSFS